MVDPGSEARTCASRRAEEARRFEVAADHFQGKRRRLLVGQIEQRFGGDRHRRQFGVPRQRPFAIAAERVEREFPASALVVNETLQHGERHRLAAALAVLQRAKHGRHVSKRAALRQETGHFQLGVEARLDPAKHLHDETVPENNG